MPRPVLRVRPATEADLPALLALGDELRGQLLPSESSRSRHAPASRAALQARYCDALADRRRHVVVVVDGPVDNEEVLGMALLSVGPANALLDAPAVHVDHAVVADRHRRRGAGRALIAAAAAFAEERDLDQLVVSVHPSSREANRWLARLGFAPLAVRRSTSVSAIRRRLAVDVPAAEHAVRRRRRLVGRVGRSVLPLGAVQERLADRRGDALWPLPE